MAEHPTSDERWAALAEGRRLPDVDARITARLQAAREATERLWGPVLPEATRRLLHDALLRARTRSTAALIREDRAGAFAGAWSDRDQHLAEWAAAVALVIAGHPELITGTPPTVRRAPRDVLRDVLRPMLAPAGFGTDRSAEYAGMLLDALELDGYEVTVRADRFASLDHDGRTAVRIPLRGRCGFCWLPVHRDAAAGRAGELLIGPWRHVGTPDDAHAPRDVEAP